MSGAAEALLAAAVDALRTIAELGVFEPAPVQAAVPYAIVDIGPESDWGHKSGAGREVRVAAVIRDAGERPVRLRRLVAEAEAALAAIDAIEGWQLVTMRLVRSRVLREDRDGASAGSRPGWVGMVEFRARMLRLALPLP